MATETEDEEDTYKPTDWASFTYGLVLGIVIGVIGYWAIVTYMT